jgi:DNA-binding YbaB/EbfC family protein
MFSKIKHLQELKSQANQIKKVLSEETVEGSAAWGKVTITMDGNQDVKAVKIDPELLSDASKVESAVKDAINDAIKKVQRVMAQKMSQFGDLNLPKLG